MEIFAISSHNKTNLDLLKITKLWSINRWNIHKIECCLPSPMYPDGHARHILPTEGALLSINSALLIYIKA